MQNSTEQRKGKFTIIIPSYNHAEYITDCLDSIKRQQFSDIEIIIIDDCSSDNTYLLEQKWVKENEDYFYRVVLVRNEQNLGVVKSINKGLKCCTGQYVMRLASDDCLLDNVVIPIIKFYNQHPEFGMICFDGIIGEDYVLAREAKDNIITMYGESDNNFRNNMLEDLYCKDYISAPGCIIPWNTYQRLGFYDEKCYIDDWEYYLRIVKNMPILFSKERIVFFRQVADSLSRSTSIRKRKMMNQGVLYVLEKYKNDVPKSVSRKVMRDQANIILREALEWQEDKFADYVLAYMRKNKVMFTMRAFAKFLFVKLIKG